MTNAAEHSGPARGRLQTFITLAGVITFELFFLALYRLRDLSIHVVAAISICLAAGALYLLLLLFLSRSADSRAAFWLILLGAVLFRATLFPLTPSLSEDMFRYRWEGRIQNYGWNPYAQRPDDPRLAYLRIPSESRFPGHDIPAIYPPLLELIFRADAWLFKSPVAFKFPFVAADLAVVLMLAWYLRRTGGRNFQLAIYAWSPLAVVEFSGSGHADALAIAGLVAALVIIRSRHLVSTFALASASLMKSFPILLFPLWFRLQGWPRSLRSWPGAALAALFAFVCFWPYRSALPLLPSTMSYYASRWQNNNASLWRLLEKFSGSPQLADGLGVGVAVGIALWAAARKLDPARAAYLIIGAVLLLSPNGYSWYFTWILPLLCFFPNPAWLLLTVLQFLSYEVLIDYEARGVWHFDPRFVWLTYAPFYGLLLCTCLRKRKPA
ncbi:MAG: hypothetical protein ACRD50_12300 [Candidatus Acidiferrales bacterium]